MKIIVADDEAPARFLLKSFLEDEGFSSGDIGEAGDGLELVAMVLSEKPRLCFVDIRMPGMDGLEALRRCVPQAAGTSWVIVSSYSEFEYARAALRLGVTEYLVKPVDPGDLRACLERFRMLPSCPEQDPAIARILDHVARNFNADVSIADLAELTGFTPNYLSAFFHKKMGETFMSYLTRVRVTEARRLLLEGGISVADAARAVGYSDVRHFSRRYREVLGTYPSENRSDGKS
ncbi:MAG TPA: response regulator [Rectinemataceae bacterium]|nr:response regulator [Rectinemataceae bacterium]